MRHLESVEEIDDELSHWVAKGPAGMTIEWEAEIFIERDAELISWRSTEESDLDNAGSVRFRTYCDATEVTVMMKYDPPAGKLGAAVAALLGQDPAKQMREDLKTFKKLMEGRANGQPNQSYGDSDNGNLAGGHDL
jgi:uncharacterized membrane protein